MTDLIATARSIAARSSGSRLPCPVCTSTLNADNFESHVGKQHANASIPT